MMCFATVELGVRSCLNFLKKLGPHWSVCFVLALTDRHSQTALTWLAFQTRANGWHDE